MRILLMTLCLVTLGFSGVGSENLESGLKPDKQLAKPVEVEGFLIQPPKDYTMHPVEAPRKGPFKVVAWASPRRPDGTASSITLTVIKTADIPEEEVPTIREFLYEMLGGIKRSRTNWSESRPKKVTINGMEALRVSWSGIDRTMKKWMHGVTFAVVDSSALIYVNIQDLPPHHNKTLVQGEKSILSLRKKKGK